MILTLKIFLIYIAVLEIRNVQIMLHNIMITFASTKAWKFNTKFIVSSFYSKKKHSKI